MPLLYFRALPYRKDMKILIMSVLLAQMSMHAPPVPMSPAQFAHATPGQNVEIAVHVDRVQRSTVYGDLLRHETDSLSKATGKRVVLYVAGGTPVVMGSANDIVQGAVLYVYGVLTAPGRVDAKRVVVDTKFVKVE